MSIELYPRETIEVNQEQIDFHKINNDINRNPRFVVHFLALDVKLHDYGHIKGLTKYRGKWFRGGYVFTTYNLKETLEHYMKVVQEYYQNKSKKGEHEYGITI